MQVNVYKEFIYFHTYKKHFSMCTEKMKAAVAAGCAVRLSPVLCVVVRAPRAVGEVVVLIARIADRVTADIAVVRHAVLAGGVLLILLAR